MHFELAYFYFILMHLKLIHKIHSYTPVVPLKPYLISNQNWKSVYLFSDQKGPKTLCNGAAHTYIYGLYREVTDATGILTSHEGTSYVCNKEIAQLIMMTMKSLPKACIVWGKWKCGFLKEILCVIYTRIESKKFILQVDLLGKIHK